MADLARQMFRDCTYDLKEISQCRDCYRFANEENPTKFWFCKPCRPFHELVSFVFVLMPAWRARSPVDRRRLVNKNKFFRYMQNKKECHIGPQKSFVPCRMVPTMCDFSVATISVH